MDEQGDCDARRVEIFGVGESDFRHGGMGPFLDLAGQCSPSPLPFEPVPVGKLPMEGSAAGEDVNDVLSRKRLEFTRPRWADVLEVCIANRALLPFCLLIIAEQNALINEI